MMVIRIFGQGLQRTITAKFTTKRDKAECHQTTELNRNSKPETWQL